MRRMKYDNEVNNKVVLACYGKVRNYTILKISKKTPLSTFDCKGKTITYV